MTIENDELTDEMRAACDAVDMTPLLGTPAERLKFALDKALQFWREKRVAETSAKVAWSEVKSQAAVASGALQLLGSAMSDSGISEELRKEIEAFLGPWKGRQ